VITLYLGWSFVAQQHVMQLGRAALQPAGTDARQVLVT